MSLTKAQLEARVTELEEAAKAAGTVGGGPVQLDDLTDEDRARLLDEAAAVLPAAPAHGGPSHIDHDAEGAAAAQSRLAEFIDPRDHLRDCPATGDGDAPLDLEAIGRRIPGTRDESAKDVTVIRCITCGGQARVDQPISDITG